MIILLELKELAPKSVGLNYAFPTDDLGSGP